MQRHVLSYILSAGLVVLLLFGCTDDAVVDPAKDDTITTFLINTGSPPGSSAGKFFTGRDSFGVALKARLSGSVASTEEGSCSTETETVSASAQGTATHMGKITAVQHHCFDPATLEFTKGAFTYSGTNGALLSGRYEATLEPTRDAGTYAIQGTLWVKDGTVKATDLPAEGRGTITGTLYPDDSFAYELDGWLLHHVVERNE